jgi:hypothetical protein
MPDVLVFGVVSRNKRNKVESCGKSVRKFDIADGSAGGMTNDPPRGASC